MHHLPIGANTRHPQRDCQDEYLLDGHADQKQSGHSRQWNPADTGAISQKRSCRNDHNTTTKSPQHLQKAERTEADLERIVELIDQTIKDGIVASAGSSVRCGAGSGLAEIMCTSPDHRHTSEGQASSPAT